MISFPQLLSWGSSKKGTRWKSSPGVFDALSAECQNDHEHLPFQLTMPDGQWSFDTAAEAAYPDLTKRVASLVKKILENKGRTFIPRPQPWIQTLAVQHRQHKKRDQLIPPFQKRLPFFLRGIGRKRGLTKRCHKDSTGLVLGTLQSNLYRKLKGSLTRWMKMFWIKLP